MSRNVILGLVLILLCGSSVAVAQGPPEMPQPVAEHAWLERLVGEWETEIEMFVPGQDPMTGKGRETVRAVGGFWVVSEQQSEMMGQPFTGLLTLGYDAAGKQYIGTWVDSMSGALWTYHGALNASQNTLTLSTEGFCPANPGELSQFKEVLELKDQNHKIFTSSIQGPDGEWTPVMRIQYRRVR